MIYKVVMSSGPEVIIGSEEDLRSFLEAANRPNQKLVFTKYGVINVSFVVSVLPHKEKIAEVNEYLKIGRSKEEAMNEVLGISPFAKILSDKMKMLSDKSRTEVQEESAREERKIK